MIACRYLALARVFCWTSVIPLWVGGEVNPTDYLVLESGTILNVILNLLLTCT